MYVCMSVHTCVCMCMYCVYIMCVGEELVSSGGLGEGQGWGKPHTVKPVLSDHVWAHKEWSLYGGGLLKEVKMNKILPFGHD